MIHTLFRAVELGIGPNNTMRNLTKIVAKKYPDSPTSIDEIIAYFNHESIKTTIGKTLRKKDEPSSDFFKHAYKCEKFAWCLFAADEVIAIIDKMEIDRRMYYSDGTFKITPYGEFAQVLLLAVDICGQVSALCQNLFICCCWFLVFFKYLLISTNYKFRKIKFRFGAFFFKFLTFERLEKKIYRYHLYRLFHSHIVWWPTERKTRISAFFVISMITCWQMDWHVSHLCVTMSRLSPTVSKQFHPIASLHIAIFTSPKRESGTKRNVQSWKTSSKGRLPLFFKLCLF